MRYLKYSDIALVPNYSECHSRSDGDTSLEFGGKRFKLPIVPANMKTVINADLARWMSENDYFYIMHRFDPEDDRLQFLHMANDEDWRTISISVGVNDSEKEFLIKSASLKQRIDYITIDIAHGHCVRMKGMIEWIADRLPKVTIIAGNVATPDAVADLSAWGADIVKVGVGQGSPCTTKDKTGFTVPMFSCVKRCSKVSFNLEEGFMISEASLKEDFDLPERIPIIADGGIKCNGDISKALCAGAKMVMAGGIFVACTDSPAVSNILGGITHKAYFGSASMENKGHSNHIEGKLKNIHSNDMTYQEKLNEIKQDLQSAISYAGGGNDLNAFKDANYIEL
jgi:GMP reductase